MNREKTRKVSFTIFFIANTVATLTVFALCISNPSVVELLTPQLVGITLTIASVAWINYTSDLFLFIFDKISPEQKQYVGFY